MPEISAGITISLPSPVYSEIYEPLIIKSFSAAFTVTEIPETDIAKTAAVADAANKFKQKNFLIFKIILLFNYILYVMVFRF